MTARGLCWYLCGLFVVAAVVQSAMTVAPGGERAQQVITIGTVCLAVVAGAAAVALRRIGRPGPPWLLRLLQALAVLATLGVGLLVGG